MASPMSSEGEVVIRVRHLAKAYKLYEIGRASCRERGEVWVDDGSSRRRHTRCLSDWSSDVCSSDLDIVVFGEIPNGLVVAWTLFLSAVTFWLGYWFFRRQQDGITDVI